MFLFIFRFIFDPPAKSARIKAHGRLFETCAYSFKMLLEWALIRDVRLFETCAKSSIYGISIRNTLRFQRYLWWLVRFLLVRLWFVCHLHTEINLSLSLSKVKNAKKKLSFRWPNNEQTDKVKWFRALKILLFSTMVLDSPCTEPVIKVAFPLFEST